jgi:hypothetical protein
MRFGAIVAPDPPEGRQGHYEPPTRFAQQRLAARDSARSQFLLLFGPIDLLIASMPSHCKSASLERRGGQ